MIQNFFHIDGNASSSALMFDMGVDHGTSWERTNRVTLSAPAGEEKDCLCSVLSRLEWSLSSPTDEANKWCPPERSLLTQKAGLPHLPSEEIIRIFNARGKRYVKVPTSNFQAVLSCLQCLLSSSPSPPAPVLLP